MLTGKLSIASLWCFLLCCLISEATTSSTICIWLIYWLNKHTQRNKHSEEALWFQRSTKFISDLHHSSYTSDPCVAVSHVQHPSLHPSTSMDNQALTSRNKFSAGHHQPTQTRRGSKFDDDWSGTNFWQQPTSLICFVPALLHQEAEFNIQEPDFDNDSLIPVTNVPAILQGLTQQEWITKACRRAREWATQRYPDQS